ncbi:hypothetical protein PQ469_00985 [Mucilaginibacter sp. KACC 22773]|uniref:hypothetical protein n=1 Tax=Mucilaginibacter sp. KACC 22773 TaxID=3025671 RepID=UPI0023651006|nr:hypothetical protein [Mucilaginibacter sp. KACC 22773]WDF78579.1 hypothetical protein PQ469_00985 [Mucilaginibacter sp. KACC 22773]
MVINTAANLIASAIFSGTVIISLCLVVVSLFKIKLTNINKAVLIKAVNIVLLFGAMIYTVMWVMEIFVAFYSGGEYEQYTLTNRLFGSYWWAAFASLVSSVLLPQMLWIKKFRSSFSPTIIIISFWLFINILAQLPFGIVGILREFRISMSYLGGLGIYMVMLVSAYMILNRKVARPIST